MTNNNSKRYRHRPPHLWLANTVGHLGLSGAISLDPERLIGSAQRSCGYDDFGPDGWRAALTRLCAALEDEAQLNMVGRLAARKHILQLLINRLRVEHAHTGAGVKISAPVFITGLPRTGSTLLHGLLAQDQQLRVPLTWEVMLPADPASNDQTIKRTDAMLNWVHRLAPRFRSIHPVGATLPQECIAITAHQFASVEFHTTFNVPTYQAWLDAQNQQEALAYHRRFVEYLDQARDTDRRRHWVFKAPAHLYALDAIRVVYPDARLVFTHRDPEAVVASIASHGVVLRNAFSDAVDERAVAQGWMHWWAEGWRRAQEFRQQQDIQVIDLDYNTLVADPVAAVASIYDPLGLELPPATEQRMQAFLAANRQDKHGRHRYTLEQFGLDPDAIRSAFANE